MPTIVRISGQRRLRPSSSSSGNPSNIVVTDSSAGVSSPVSTGTTGATTGLPDR